MFDVRLWSCGAASALAASLIFACSDEATSASKVSADADAGDVEGDGGPGLSGPADPALYARALCEADIKCRPVGFRREHESLSACIAWYVPRTTAALRAPGNTVTAAQLAACTTKLGVTCDDTLDTLPECAFRGTQSDGQPCAFSGQCAGGSCVDVMASCGTCTAAIPAGKPCVSTSGQRTCESGLECVAGACRPLGGVGSGCTEAAACKPTLTCTAGSCQPRGGNGAPCKTNAYECDEAKGLVCVPNSPAEADGTCKPQAFAKANEPCGTDPATGAVTVCEAPSTCSSAGADLGTCELPPTSPCTADTGCRFGETCVSGKCTYVVPACK